MSYWVGGTGNWTDAANHWAATSGGSPDAGNLPDATKHAIFDANSSATAYTVTVNGTAPCDDFTVGLPGTSGVVTVAGGSALNIAGSISLATGTLVTHTGAMNHVPPVSTTKTITMNGVVPAWVTNVNGPGTTRLVDTYETIRNISKGASGIFDPNGQLFRITFPVGNTGLFVFGAWTFYDLALLSHEYTQWQLVGVDVVVTNQFSAQGDSPAHLLGISNRATFPAAQLTITAASIGTLENVSFRGVNGAGAAAPFTGTNIGQESAVTGITVTPPVTRYLVAGAGPTVDWMDSAVWSASSGGATGASIPLPQDDVIGDANSFSAPGVTVLMTNGPNVLLRIGKNIDFSGVTNSPTFLESGGSGVGDGVNWFGDMTLSPNMTWDVGRMRWFPWDGVATLDCNGLSLTGITYQMDVTATGTGYAELGSDLSLPAGGFTLIAGEFDANGHNFTAKNFVANNANQSAAVHMGTGTWTITAAAAINPNAWNVDLLTSLDAGSSTLQFTDATATAKLLKMGSFSYNNVELAGGGSGEWQFTGSPTFAGFTHYAGATIKRTAGTNITLGSWTRTGALSNVTTIDSLTAASHTWTKSGGGTISLDYMNLAHSTGNPGNTFYARGHSTDSGGNSGWTFADLNYSLDADAGSFGESGADAGLLAARAFAVEVGVFSEVGQDAALIRDARLDVQVGSYVEVGSAASLLKGSLLLTGGGSFAETGNDAMLLVSRSVAAASGAYALTGSDANLSVGHRMAAGAGRFDWTVNAVHLMPPRAERIYEVQPEDRRYLVAAEDRVVEAQ